MAKVLGSTGDIYQMLNSTAVNNRQINANAVNLYNANQSPLQDGETKKERASSILNQGLKTDAGTTSTGKTTERAVDNGLNVNVTDSGTSSNTELLSIIDNTLNIQKLWLGEDYEWSTNEAEDFKTILRLSSDPQKTASRYIASKGYATLFGFDVKDVYNNLDEISQFYIGDVYDAHDIPFWQKIKNGFTRNDLMSLEYEYMVADMAGNTERVAELDEEIKAKQAELGDSSSAIPTSQWDEIETAVLENFGYIAQPTAKGSLASSIVTALGIATASAFPIAAPAILAGTASIATAGTVAMAGKTMYEWAAGEKYYSLMNDEEYEGVRNKGQAYLLATIDGVGTAVIETIMDGVTSRLLGKVTGKMLGKIGINTLTDFARKGISNRIADAVIEWATGAVDEGFFNEAPEYILGEITSSIYKYSNGIIDKKTWGDRYDELKESIVQGILVGGIYGALAIPSSLKSQKRMAVDLRRTANASETMSEFENATKDMKPEGLSDEDFDTARTMIWKASQEQKQQRREYLQKEFAGTVLESEEVASQELFSTVDADSGEETSIVPDGSVYRTDDNALYSEVTTNNKQGTQTVWYGNPEDHSVYGIVQIKSDGDTQTVESVRVRNGYESIRSEMVRDAISSTLSTETNVEWNPTTKGLQSVKEELENNNPNKTGLVYSSITRGNDSDIQSLKSQIKKANPNLTDAEATMAARLTSIADVGTNTIKYETATKENTGRDVSTIRGATNTAKALIYAGQNTDSSTFVHELFHAVASIRTKEAENLSNEIRSALQNEETRSQLESFIKNNLAVWGADADINKIMSSLSEIKENSNAKSWTVAQNENLAQLYEAYRRSSRSIQQSLPQAIRNLLQKLTQFINKIYGTLKDTVPLNENIAKAYDSLMGLDELTNETKRVESKEAFKEFQGIREKAGDNIIYEEITGGAKDPFKNREQNKESIDNFVNELSTHDLDKRYSATDFYKPYSVCPIVLQELGYKGLPLWIRKSKVSKILNTHANIDIDTIGLTVMSISDPIAVFASLDKEGNIKKNQLVVVTEVENEEGKRVIVPLHMNERAANIEVDIIASVYPKDSGSIFDKWASAGALRYLKNKEIGSQLMPLQLRGKENQSQLENVLYREDIVKKYSYGNDILYQASNTYNDEIFDIADARIVERNNLISGQDILFLDKLLDNIDSVETIDEAEAVARGEYERELSDSEKRIAEQLFDIDSSLPEGWENIYESEAEDRLQKEIELEKALTDVEESLLNWDKLENPGRDPGSFRAQITLISATAYLSMATTGESNISAPTFRRMQHSRKQSRTRLF